MIVCWKTVVSCCHGDAVDEERPGEGYWYPRALGRALSWLRGHHAPGICILAVCLYYYVYVTSFSLKEMIMAGYW